MAENVDIAPDLLRLIKQKFQSGCVKNRKIANIRKKIEDKTATHGDSDVFAQEVGEALAEAFHENVSSDVLPDGRMYYNIAQKIVEPPLETVHGLVGDVTVEVQEVLNEKQDIKLTPQRVELDKDRIDGILKFVSNAEKYDDVKKSFEDAIVNFSRSVADTTLRKNAQLHSRAGFKTKVIREAGAKACEWCRSLVGTYDYENVANTGNDVWRRHLNCNCTIDFISEKGAQRVYNYREDNTPEARARRRAASERLTNDRETVKMTDRRKPEESQPNFYVGRNKRVLKAQYKEWIGDNKINEYLENAKSEEAKKYIRSDFREKSFIGDGSTASIRKFEIATGLRCGRDGNNHSQKVSDLINQLNKILSKQLPEADRKMLYDILQSLKEVAR